MGICIIQVPYMAGATHDGASDGPRRYLQAGVDRLLGERGVAVTVERVERPRPFRDHQTASLTVNEQLARVVRRAAGAGVGQLPLVLAGSCDVCMGILAGVDHACCGVIWIDAHGDFNTPASTTSGFFAGMSLAVIAGHCHRDHWGQIGDSTPVPEAGILMLGVRDLDPAERDRLDNSAIRVVGWRDGKPQGDVQASIDELVKRVPDVYLHIDMDAFDPQVALGIVDPPAPGGLSMRDMDEVIRAVAPRFRIRAVALATYNPGLDRDDKTLRAGLRIIDGLAACIGDRGPSAAYRSSG